MLFDMEAQSLTTALTLNACSQDGEEYGDPSCPMGHSGDGCFNSMHAYKLGWATNPVAFDTKDLRPGEGWGMAIRAL